MGMLDDGTARRRDMLAGREKRPIKEDIVALEGQS
jgi:hypothetical protein